ncbi:hypothetical protein TSOC_000056 [Tetrabaena socialis]|uniref:Uncharacterized protein n=1 Tax=Tetrabaena socialis TaxID=47790 RepID=A0A2J8AKD8_9CHLO|nr:hypothetical protein TSOC_000056 [Tetrabaena socialis]|eukprot:PNH12982.1 hypothetical protein TSOC_000056 [Tetrabaena socialis]
MGGFVKSEGTMGTADAQTFGKIEVVASKLDQRKAVAKADAVRLMPPPPPPPPAAPEPAGRPPIESVPSIPGPPKCPVPGWADLPPAGSRLLVYKDGHVIQEVALAKLSG